MYYSYVLYSAGYDRIYIGQTNNLDIRLSKHNAGLVKSTKPYIPWKLVYFESYETKSGAVLREQYLKSHMGRDFIRNHIINWQSPAKPD
jgi:putative endonuclease